MIVTLFNDVVRVRCLCLLIALLIALPGLAEIERGVLAGGTQWETGYVVVDSGVAGPTVMVLGGVHGDEPAGAAAADQIAGWPIVRGRLVVVPRVNVLGLEAKTRRTPNSEAKPIDLNREFPVNREPEHALAKAVWGLVLKEKPDWLIDMHEGFDFRQQNPKSVGASVIFTRGDEAVDAAVADMLEQVNATIEKEDRRLVELGDSGPIGGSLANKAEEQGIRAMILETSKKDQRLPLRTRQHRVMVHTLLMRLEMTTPAALWNVASAGGDALRVAVFEDSGVGRHGPGRVERLMAEAGCVTQRIDGVDVRAGVLTQFDMVVCPGGSASRQAKALGEEGRALVCGFVEEGGGYVGICAGAYLATVNYSWSLGLIDAKTLHKGKQWNRGVGPVQMQWTGWGEQELAVLAQDDRPKGDDRVKVNYANGPILGPGEREEIEDYEVVAWFRTELAKNGTQPGLMVDTPAVVAGRYGKGRVLVISPHPESTKGLADEARALLMWAQPVERAKAQ